MKFEGIIQSKNFKLGLKILAGILMLAIVFSVGLVIGLEKARFSYNWGESYYRTFAGPSRFYLDRDYMDAHGASGKILKIEGMTITVKDDDNMEKNVLINNGTIILRGPRHVSINDLTTNDTIVAIGKPDNKGQVQATLIRVMPGPLPPEPPEMPTQ